MSFVTQDDVFAAIEPVMSGVFEEFADGKSVTPAGEYPRIPYKESLLKYGTDKPDLRNPLLVHDVGERFQRLGLRAVRQDRRRRRGGPRGRRRPNTAEKSRKFFDDMNEWARGEGFAGLGYATRKGGEWGGPIAKNHGTEGMDALADAMGLGPDDGIFFAAGKEAEAARLAGLARTRVAEQLDLIEQGSFRFCWIVDYPMFEYQRRPEEDRLQPQPVLDAARRDGSAGDEGPARHPRLAI